MGVFPDGGSNGRHLAVGTAMFAIGGEWAAAAVLIVPTVALAVPWLTELHRLFIA